MGHSFIAWNANKHFETECLIRHALLSIDGSRPRFASDLRETEDSWDTLVFHIDGLFLDKFDEISKGHASGARNHLRKLVKKYELIRLEIFP